METVDDFGGYISNPSIDKLVVCVKSFVASEIVQRVWARTIHKIIHDIWVGYGGKNTRIGTKFTPTDCVRVKLINNCHFLCVSCFSTAVERFKVRRSCKALFACCHLGSICNPTWRTAFVANDNATSARPLYTVCCYQRCDRLDDDNVECLTCNV